MEETRRMATSKYLRGMRTALDHDVPKILPEKPVINPAILLPEEAFTGEMMVESIGFESFWAAEDLTPAEREEKRKAYWEARERWEFAKGVIPRHDYSRDLIVDLYRKAPFNTPELKQFAAEILEDGEAVDDLIQRVEVRIKQRVEAEAAKAALEEMREGWGEVVEGVQVRLRADKEVWNAGEIPTFKAEIHSEGKAAVLGTAMRRSPCDLEVDGQWYRWIFPSMASIYRPLDEFRRGRIVLDGSWRIVNRGEQLVVTPGTHKVRVAFSVRVEDGRKRIRVVSNVVEIKVLPAAEEEGQGEKTEGRKHSPVKISG